MTVMMKRMMTTMVMLGISLLLDLYPPVMFPQKVSYLELPESTFGQDTNCVYVYLTLCYKIENDTQMMMMMTDTWSVLRPLRAAGLNS